MSIWDGFDLLASSSVQSEQQGGVLTMAALDSLIDSLREQIGVYSDWRIPVSPGWLRRMRHLELIGRMYRAYPAPRYKIRKCHLRKLQARWHKARRRIRKIEQSERAQEEVAMSNG